ncbi:hypothetical protein HGH93_12180 [Chitinophaga polysaccharea]|uniref:hypothetical protein n=1 Tax=Chitinophaga polysaccharea TaxID=1293035 RepID=UPI0014558E77|nr:hypothetical protein [Chitinophaga polysaccharea]NLR58865.1 hypothetical protein [Chitinophaga polysaccharea]
MAAFLFASAQKSPIPLISSRQGNCLKDLHDENIVWYLPVYNLVQDVDTGFSFVAEQAALPGSEGDAFNTATLKFTINKTIPPEAVAMVGDDPNLVLKEVPLGNLQLSLGLTYKDSQNVEAHLAFPVIIEESGNGNYAITVGNIKGDAVVILYENLMNTGGVQISFSATFAAWRRVLPPPAPPKQLPLPRVPNKPIKHITPKFLAPNDDGTGNNTTEDPIVDPNPDLNGAPSGDPGTDENVYLDADTGEILTGVIETEAFDLVIDFERKYAVNGYQLAYLLIVGSVMRPIINVGDLKNFNGNLTEFSQLKVIDTSKYPSIQALYYGVLSKVVIIVPRSYGIVRKSNICAASCLALIDSTPTGEKSCKFQFQFEITADVSPVDFALLSKEIKQQDILGDYTLKVADRVSDKFSSGINSAFCQDTKFNASSKSGNFILTAMIVDTPDKSAVASTQIFIAQLCKVSPGCVVGKICIRLDDPYPNEVSSSINLSLPGAVSEGGLVATINKTVQNIVLSNVTSYNFTLLNYLIYSPSESGKQVTANKIIPTMGSTTILLMEDFSDPQIALDYVEQPQDEIKKAEMQRYMKIDTQDVQNVNRFIGVNSAQVAYLNRGIKAINVQVNINNLPSVSVPQFTLTGNNMDGGVNISLPLEFLITALSATIGFIIQFLDANKPSVSFTKQNNFIEDPVFFLKDTDITT